MPPGLLPVPDPLQKRSRVAATLTDELTRVSVADIEKWEDGPDGTLYVYGRCTTPERDTDEQVVDSGWSGPALKRYMALAPTVRVQHNPQRDPAGSAVRVDVDRDGDGAHWLKAAVDEPIAQRLVRKGHLRAFSVGIARPVIERDVTGKARGGIIKGGEIVEVSLVDSPANRSCFLEIAKSAADGTPELTGKVIGADDAIQKALNGDLTKGDGPAWDFEGIQRGSMTDLGTCAQGDLSISFTPNDLARLVQAKYVEKHYGDLALKAVAEAERAVYKRDIDTATRRRLASEGHALPDGSYPIENTGDLHNAAILARSGHGDAAGARRLIAREARERGVADPLDDSKAGKGGSDEKARKAYAAEALAAGVVSEAEAAQIAAKEADPDVTKEPEGAPGDKPEPVKKAKKKPKGARKLPPWLNKPSGDDEGGGGDEKGSSGGSGACKSAADHIWAGVIGSSAVECSKCHTTPAEAAGVTASPMDPAPVGELMESTPPMSAKGSPTPQSASGASDAHAMEPVPQHREPDGAGVEPFEHDAKLPATGQGETPTRLEAPTLKASPEVSALLRFCSIGIDAELGKLHDLTCPAFHPDEVQRFHPFADIASLVDTGMWQRKSLEAACGPLENALRMHELHQAALALKSADEADLNQWRADAHKAFRDANPGPSAYPSPGMVSPQKYSRPLITDGRAATSTGHSGPNTSPQVATTAPNAHSFDRPPLEAAHASPSPSFMKGGFAYPPEQGVPTQLTYARQVKDQQREALSVMHDRLGSMYPAVCPMDLDSPAPGMRHPVPATAGIGKGTGTEMHISVTGPDGAALSAEQAGAVAAQIQQRVMATRRAPVLAAEKARPEDDAGLSVDADVYKGFKKQRKKLGKKVLAGKMTVDEARAKMGRQFAQKGTSDLSSQEIAEGVRKGTMAVDPSLIPVPAAAGLTPDLIKAAVREALRVETVPLEASAIGSFDVGPSVEAAVTKAVGPLLEKIQATDTKLAEAQRVIDAIADQPDPSTASFSGLAFSPVRKSARPAGVTDIAETAERSRQMMIRHMESTVNSASDPYEREAARASLERLRGGA